MSRVCPKCGAENRDSAKFCVVCTHQLARIHLPSPRVAAAKVRRRNRYRRGWPVDDGPPDDGPASTYAPAASLSPENDRRKGTPTSWFTAIGLGVLLLIVSISWAVTANRPPHSHAPLTALAQAQPQNWNAAPAPAQGLSQQSAQTQAQPASVPAPVASGSVAGASTAAATSAPQAPPPQTPRAPDEQASGPPDQSAQAQDAAPATERPSAASAEQTPSRSHRKKPSAMTPETKPARRDHSIQPPRSDQATRLAQQSARNNKHPAAPASAPEPAPPRPLCSGMDFIARTVCLMRECDKPANASLSQCVQLKQRIDALRNNTGNRPY